MVPVSISKLYSHTVELTLNQNFAVLVYQSVQALFILNNEQSVYKHRECVVPYRLYYYFTLFVYSSEFFVFICKYGCTVIKGISRFSFLEFKSHIAAFFYSNNGSSLFNAPCQTVVEECCGNISFFIYRSNILIYIIKITVSVIDESHSFPEKFGVRKITFFLSGFNIDIY